MSLSRPRRLAYLALALGFCFSWVNLTSPGAFVCTVAESVPDTDDDGDREIEIELASPNNSSRQSSNAHRPVGYIAHTSSSTHASKFAPLQATRGARIASADSLGRRLRC